MNGLIIPGTPIAVDFWKLSKAPEQQEISYFQVQLFFLTHLHADHIAGLTSTWRIPIYTSPTNAALLSHKFKFPKNVVQKLEIGETYQIPLDSEEEHILSVTALDANHVPGAVMFLFQGYFGNYLYCGDMRWYPELLQNPVLKNIVELHELDCVFLDNTFSAPYCNFPSREEAKKQVFSIIDQYPDSEIKIGIRSLGKEALLEAVAHRYQERILVSLEKYEMLQVLQASDVFTTDPNQSRIHAVSINQITSKSHDKWNATTSTISIILTALYVGWPNGPYSSSYSRGLYVVPYSDHSSYPELINLVACLAPRKVVPIVKHWSTSGWWSDPSAPDQTVKADMSVYEHLLTTPPPEVFFTPSAVEETMKTGSKILHHPELRHCGLRRGLMPAPRRARTLARGVIYTSPEPRTVSPTPTASMSLDISMPSAPSTPTHTTHPWKDNEMSVHSSKISIFTNQLQCENPSPSLRGETFAVINSPNSVSSYTQTSPCRLCVHKRVSKLDNLPSYKNRATQTPHPENNLPTDNRTETEIDVDHRDFPLPNDFHSPSLAKVDPKLKKLRHESVETARQLVSEVVSECNDSDDNWNELLRKTRVLCNAIRATNSLF